MKTFYVTLEDVRRSWKRAFSGGPRACALINRRWSARRFDVGTEKGDVV